MMRVIMIIAQFLRLTRVTFGPIKTRRIAHIRTKTAMNSAIWLVSVTPVLLLSAAATQQASLVILASAWCNPVVQSNKIST